MPTSVKLSVKKFYIFLNRLLMALVINCPQACNYIQQKISVNIFFFMEFFINIPAPHQPNNPSTNHHSGEQPSSHVILSEQSEREGLSSTISSPPEGEGGRSPDEGCKKPSISDQHKPTDNQSPGIVKGEALDAIQGGGAGNLADPCQKSEKSIYNCHCRHPQPTIPSPPEGAKIPLILYKFQLDFIKNLLHKIDSNSPLLVEKSKQMGTTTCTVLTFLWYWLFKTNSDFLIMTPFKKSLYTKNDSSTAFGLLLFVLQHLPKSFLPDKGFIFQQNRHRQYYCYLENLNNGNRIYGISAAKKRTLSQLHHSFKAILLDELAFHNNADYHWQQLSGLSKCLIAVSCPNGSTNLFAELITTNFAPVCRLHWALHPLCDKHWYESLIAHADPIFVEQFVNISYTLRPIRKKIQKAAFKVAETVVSVVENKIPDTHKHKYSPNVSCLSNEKRKRHKNNLDIVTAPSFDMVKKRLTMNLTKTINMPVFTKKYGRDDLVECWTNVSLITDFKTPLSLNTATTAVEIVNRFSKVNIADFKAIEEDNVVNYYVGYSIPTIPSLSHVILSEQSEREDLSLLHNSGKLNEPKVFGQLSGDQHETTPNSYSNYTFDPLVLTTKKIVIIPDYFDDLFPPVRENPLKKAQREQLEREREFEERLKHMTLEEVIAEYNKLMPDWPVYYVDGMITHYPTTTIPSTAANPGEPDGPKISDGLSSSQPETTPYGHCEKPQATKQSIPTPDKPENPSTNNQSPGIVKGEALDTIQGGRAGNLADPCQNPNKPTIPSPPEGEGGQSPDEGYKSPSTNNQSPGIVKGEALDTIQGGRAGNLADPCQNPNKPTIPSPPEGEGGQSPDEGSKKPSTNNNQPPRFHPRTTRWNIKFLPQKRPPPDSS